MGCGGSDKRLKMEAAKQDRSSQHGLQQRLCASDPPRLTTRICVLEIHRLASVGTSQACDLTSLDQREIMSVSQRVDGAIEWNDNVSVVVSDHEDPVFGVVESSFLADVVCVTEGVSERTTRWKRGDRANAPRTSLMYMSLGTLMVVAIVSTPGAGGSRTRSNTPIASAEEAPVAVPGPNGLVAE